MRVATLKGEVSRKFAVVSKPKNVCLFGRNNDIIVKFVINYHPSAIKLSIMPLARGRVGRYGLKLEKC